MLHRLIKRVKRLTGLEKRELETARGGGERQASKNLNRIRADHRGRYTFASKFSEPGFKILDMACGVGYGSYTLATTAECNSIDAVDISPHAIKFGKRYYKHEKISYHEADCLTIELQENGYDLGVSFETFEHIEEPDRLLAQFGKAIKPGGMLILSTPNESGMPYDPEKFPFHIRHYEMDEVEEFLARHGFEVSGQYGQVDRMSEEVQKEPPNPLFLVVTATKK